MPLISEVHTLISENSTEMDITKIYEDGSVVRNLCNSWAFASYCGGKAIKVECGGFAVTTAA